MISFFPPRNRSRCRLVTRLFIYFYFYHPVVKNKSKNDERICLSSSSLSFIRQSWGSRGGIVIIMPMEYARAFCVFHCYVYMPSQTVPKQQVHNII